jgi:hypothetical protein
LAALLLIAQGTSGIEASAPPLLKQLLESVMDFRHFQDGRELAHPAPDPLDIRPGSPE